MGQQGHPQARHRALTREYLDAAVLRAERNVWPPEALDPTEPSCDDAHGDVPGHPTKNVGCRAQATFALRLGLGVGGLGECKTLLAVLWRLRFVTSLAD